MEDSKGPLASSASSPSDGDSNAPRGDYGADTALQRRLSSRHVTMIGLGSSIGMGLWLGSGKSLANGGPASLFLGYVLAGSMVWAVSHSIGEMAVMYPLPSAFVQWTGKFVDPSAAFALGWSNWFGYAITVANELQAVNTVLSFWTDALPVGAWITIFLAVIILINIFGVNVFGEVEVVASTIKFGWIFVVIISMIVTSAGGGPTHEAIGFRYWNATPFINGFKGFLSVMPTCIFAMSGSETSGLVASETANPRKAIPKAVKSIWIRLALFYLMGSLMVTINVDPKNPNLFGGSGSNASPFVLAYREAGLPAMAHIMNAIIFISVVSTGSISVFSGSRTAAGLAHLNMAPAGFAKADKSGRPWWGLISIFVVGGGLSYLNVGASAANVFTWLSNLTSLFTLFVWGLICASHLRFRHAWVVQGRSLDDLPWKSPFYPYLAWWGVILCSILMVVEFYLSVWPLHEDPSAETFFANFGSVFIIMIAYFGARIYYRGPWWVDSKTIDLDEGRRFYVDATDEEKAEKRNKVKEAMGKVFKK